jgi:hypothetical protein
MSFNAATAAWACRKRCRHTGRKLCWRPPLILITCAGILTRNVEPTSQNTARTFSPAKSGYLSEIAHWIHPQLLSPLAKAILGLSFYASKAIEFSSEKNTDGSG